MMEYPPFSRITATILQCQHRWLTQKAIEASLSTSAILREAIELLMAKYSAEGQSDSDRC